MKFIDPLATLQYMGGALPIHIAMLIYCIDELWSNEHHFSKCRRKFSKLNYEDIVFMLISHSVYVIFLITKFCMKKETSKYLSVTLGHLNMTIYMMAILYVMHKLYIQDHLVEEEIFALCPPSRWKDISRAE